jgi:hypothetical protein
MWERQETMLDYTPGAVGTDRWGGRLYTRYIHMKAKWKNVLIYTTKLYNVRSKVFLVVLGHKRRALYLYCICSTT